MTHLACFQVLSPKLWGKSELSLLCLGNGGGGHMHTGLRVSPPSTPLLPGLQPESLCLLGKKRREIRGGSPAANMTASKT